ncbi:hypothetical protein Bca52824_059292 [Brassica carinata]|uniref:Uncharacterized protein n=1 Tax=Brassica carinata TaxID=52824 RepID=A0A8X7UFG2_BRACI|nr:hypothetical protein Bca52824_059292 [Brassica carinata]
MASGSLKSLVTSAVTIGMTEARARQRSPHKILRKKLFGDKVAEWYPYDITNEDPNLEMLKRRDKVPPRKGNGRRAAKRNK